MLPFTRARRYCPCKKLVEEGPSRGRCWTWKSVPREKQLQQTKQNKQKNISITFLRQSSSFHQIFQWTDLAGLRTLSLENEPNQARLRQNQRRKSFEEEGQRSHVSGAFIRRIFDCSVVWSCQFTHSFWTCFSLLDMKWCDNTAALHWMRQSPTFGTWSCVPRTAVNTPEACSRYFYDNHVQSLCLHQLSTVLTLLRFAVRFNWTSVTTTHSRPLRCVAHRFLYA